MDTLTAIIGDYTVLHISKNVLFCEEKKFYMLMICPYIVTLDFTMPLQSRFTGLHWKNGTVDH